MAARTNRLRVPLGSSDAWLIIQLSVSPSPRLVNANCREVMRAAEPATCLFQADDELGGVGSPVDGDHVRAGVRRRDFFQIVRNDGGHRNHETLAEIAARVAGN